MKIGIIGAAGRMGRTLIKEVLKNDACSLAGGVEREGSEHIGQDLGSLIGEDNVDIAVTDDLKALINESDAIIDFTSPESTIATAGLAAKLKTAHIIGTTGLSDEQTAQLENFAKETVIVQAPNMSVGVNLLLSLVEQAAAKMDDSYDIEIVEMHHKNKVDAPSGTALAIGNSAARGRNVTLSDVATYAREGQTGVRPKGEIGFATLRGGDVVGDHTAIFAGDGELLELAHKASDRAIFASGALRAALWTKDQNPGSLYSMKDVLGI